MSLSCCNCHLCCYIILYRYPYNSVTSVYLRSQSSTVQWRLLTDSPMRFTVGAAARGKPYQNILMVSTRVGSAPEHDLLCFISLCQITNLLNTDLRWWCATDCKYPRECFDPGSVHSVCWWKHKVSTSNVFSLKTGGMHVLWVCLNQAGCAMVRATLLRLSNVRLHSTDTLAAARRSRKHCDSWRYRW
jgi:hypothetical protein